MKRFLLLLCLGFLVIVSCNKNSSSKNADDTQTTAPAERQCASCDVLQQQLKDDPTLAARMDAIERFTRDFEAHPDANRLVNGVLIVPVEVNVLYRNGSE